MLFHLLQIEPPGGLSEALSNSPVLALGVMFGAGVLTSLTPCVYPMIPITSAVIAGTAREDQPKSRTIGLTLTYAVGLAMLYATLGAIAGMTGQLFGTVSASPWALFAIGNLLVLFALSMLHNAIVFPEEQIPVQDFDELLGLANDEDRSYFSKKRIKQGRSWTLPVLHIRF